MQREEKLVAALSPVVTPVWYSERVLPGDDVLLSYQTAWYHADVIVLVLNIALLNWRYLTNVVPAERPANKLIIAYPAEPCAWQDVKHLAWLTSDVLANHLPSVEPETLRITLVAGLIHWRLRNSAAFTCISQPVSVPLQLPARVRQALPMPSDPARPNAQFATKSRMLRFPRGRGPVMGSLLSAAAVILLVLWQATGLVQPGLPDYKVHLVESKTKMLGSNSTGTAQRVQLGSISHLRVSLQPQHAPSRKVELKVYLAQGAELARWNAPVRGFATGNFEIDVPLDGRDYQLPSGNSELIFVIAAPGELPADEQLKPYLQRGAGGHQGLWILMRQPIAVNAGR